MKTSNVRRTGTIVDVNKQVIEDETVITHKKLARLMLQKMEEEETKRELQAKSAIHHLLDSCTRFDHAGDI